MYGPVRVLLPPHGVGLSHDEVTIAEALRDFAGYTTGIVGKWHLGEFLYFIYYIYFAFALDVFQVFNYQIFQVVNRLFR